MRLMSVSIAATAVITAVRAAINPRMAAERPAIPSLALRAVIDEGGGERAGQPDPKHDRQASDLIFQGHSLADSFLRALISERSAWARNDFTCTALKKPVRAKCARPRASLRSVLWVASDLSAW